MSELLWIVVSAGGAIVLVLLLVLLAIIYLRSTSPHSAKMAEEQAQMNKKPGAGAAATVSVASGNEPSTRGNGNTGWWLKEGLGTLWITLLVIAALIAVLYFGVHASSFESPSLGTVWAFTKNHWLWILLAGGLVCMVPSFVPDKQKGRAEGLQLFIVLAVFLLFTALPVANAIWGDKEPGSSPQRQHYSAAPQEDCTKSRPCVPVLRANGSTDKVTVPPGKGVCFEPSFWDNIRWLGYTTSYQGGREKRYECTREQVLAGTCHEKTGDAFRFVPEDGVPLPHYWFAQSGSNC